MASAILLGMELTIDKSGRVVIPKKLRDHLGVRNGLTVEVIETGEGLLLKPRQRPSNLIRKNGLLIFRGPEEPGDRSIDLTEVLDDLREERIREIAGR